MILFAFGASLALFAARRVWVLMQAIRMDKQIPLHLTLIAPLSMLGVMFPTTWWNLGLGFIWRDKKTLYHNNPLRIKRVTPIIFGSTLVYSGNLATFRQVLATNSVFFKPIEAIEDAQFLGLNVVGSEGEDWKRHRRITAPAFNHTTYQNVWTTTVNVYHELLEKEGWLGADEAVVPNFNLITRKLALFIVSIVGFGLPMTWDSPERDAAGRLSIQAMVFQITTNVLIRSRTPRWAYYLGIPKLSKVDEAYRQFEQLMTERIPLREEELMKAREAREGDADMSDEIRDVFGRLVNARLTEGRLSLSDQEIIGNCFIFVFAGHETTALTLSAVVGLLGLYSETQEWVYQSIKSVLGDREPTFDDYDALENVLACFYEALRLFPPAFLMFRQARTDTILKLPHSDNPQVVENISIRKGTNVIMDFFGMSYDLSTFPDPEAFKPWRWTKSANSSSSEFSANEATRADDVPAPSIATALDGFVGFSTGPRTCLGHKFAKVEAVSFLTLLLREWRVEAIMRDGESREQWRARVLEPIFNATLAFGDIPVRLVRR